MFFKTKKSIPESNAAKLYNEFVGIILLIGLGTGILITSSSSAF